MTPEISTQLCATRVASSALDGARCDARGSVGNLDQRQDR